MKYILYEDFEILKGRINDLEQQIFALGSEFSEAVNQSSETWHDNAPFDTAVEKQSLLKYELDSLKSIASMAKAYTKQKTAKIQYGSLVGLEGPKQMKLAIGGEWVGRVELDGHSLVACMSPIAMALIGKKLGDRVQLPRGEFCINAVN